MWRQPPIWEPKGTKFRPYSIATLIFFYIGKVFGRLFGRRRCLSLDTKKVREHVVEKEKLD